LSRHPTTTASRSRLRRRTRALVVSTALGFNQNGSDNTATGSEALLFNHGQADFNSAYGYQALRNNAGTSNTATGTQALLDNTSGDNNVADGLTSSRFGWGERSPGHSHQSELMYSLAMAIVAPRREHSAPAFLRLAADSLRWRLLSELARSDRRVRELCGLLERPQSLVSYHLGQLRAEGVVSSHRSAADRRDSYYTVDLGRCGELLASGGGTLHPALRLAAPRPREWDRASRSPRPRVLFLCTGNSARSQIAEALVEEITGGTVEARSAGSHPRPLHPNAVKVMRERGVDIAGRRSKHLSEFAEERFDCVISLCDRVREVCPEFPDHPDLVHWSIPDPAREGSTADEAYGACERTADELATRIPFLLELIANTSPQEVS
jgi:ArsR family transcriptional regulator, arsenate/arsenite/antimonite-responsive transcriptional repressor / arsenate reductase (thioredoxin)